MNGRAVYVNAVKRMSEGIRDALAANQVTIDDVDLFFFHQANLRINQYIQEQMKAPAEKFPHNIERFGNTSSASVPMALNEAVRDGRIKRGETVLLEAFGGGFTWGSALLRY